MFAFLLNTFIFALVISLLFTGVHYLYLKVMNQDDEYTRNEYIMFFVKYYVISLTSLMGYQFLNDYLKTILARKFGYLVNDGSILKLQTSIMTQNVRK